MIFKYPLTGEYTLNSLYESDYITPDAEHIETAKHIDIQILHQTVLNSNPYSKEELVSADEFKVFMCAEKIKSIVTKANILLNIRIYRTTQLSTGQLIYVVASENCNYNYIILFTTDYDGWPITKENNYASKTINS